VTGEVSRQFSRSRLVELTEDRAAADLRLEGAVTRFESTAEAYDANDDISEYTALMTVRASLVRCSDGTVLWQGDFSRSQTYPAVIDKSLQQEGKGLAAQVTARRIAEDLMARMMTTF
jgi:ABC-type uncharacterized transport system auxiliary subunit